MASKKIGCLNTVKRFSKLLQKKYAVEAIYIFGSHVKGFAYKDSDIDIAVISKSFSRLTPLQRLVVLGKLAWKANTPEIEAIGYTPEEFYHSPPWEFSSEIQKTGVLFNGK